MAKLPLFSLFLFCIFYWLCILIVCRAMYTIPRFGFKKNFFFPVEISPCACFYLLERC